MWIFQLVGPEKKVGSSWAKVRLIKLSPLLLFSDEDGNEKSSPVLTDLSCLRKLASEKLTLANKLIKHEKKTV